MSQDIAAGGNQGLCGAFRRPACVSAAVKVAASYDGNYGYLEFPGYCDEFNAVPYWVTCFSNISENCDLFLAAPGYDIQVGGFAGDGTSQATAHCSGAAALVFSKNKWLDAGYVRGLMWATATDMPWAFPDCPLPPHPRHVNALAAVNSVAPAPATGDVNADGALDGLDIQPFVRVFLDSESATAQEIGVADITQNGRVDMADVPGFVRLLLYGSFPPQFLMRQLLVYRLDPGTGGTITLSFRACDADPFAPCGTVLSQGCGAPTCSITVSCDQADAGAMAAAISSAINAEECPGYSATNDGGGYFTVTYPVGLCLCLYDSATGESRPLSKTCAGLSVCGGAWRLSYADTCPQPPQVACVPIGVFGPERILLNFDQLDAGTYLFDQYPGVTFEHAVVVQSEYAASPQNVITPDESGAPIRVNFDPPVLRVGCFIDADGFTPERMPQIRAFGVEGTIESCNYEQGLNFKGLSLPDGIPIAAIELGCLRLWDCGWGRSDSFDDLVFEYATAEGSPEGPMMLNNGGGGGDSDEAAPASGQDQAAASPSPFLPYDETTAAAWEAFGDWMAAQTWGPESGLTDEEQWALTLAKLHELGLVRR